MDFQADSNDFESSDKRPVTPQELIETAATATKELLPSKSHNRYEQVYEGFQQWKKLKEATSNSERVLLAYFTELKQNYLSSTLWSKYSMLKSTMKINDQVDISTYASLIAMLKKESKGHIPKQARTFTENELKLFIDTAADDLWLDVKVTKFLLFFLSAFPTHFYKQFMSLNLQVVCIFGLCGACRSHELASVIMEHIIRYEDMYFVTIPREFTKTDKDNAFGITGELFHIVKKYEALRPSHVKTDRFFLNFQKGKCTVQVIGKSKFYGMPRRIADFLKLPDPERYTGNFEQL